MCCTTLSAPGESGSMGLSVSLQIHTLCHNLPEWCSHAPGNMTASLSLSLCSFLLSICCQLGIHANTQAPAVFFLSCQWILHWITFVSSAVILYSVTCKRIYVYTTRVKGVYTQTKCIKRNGRGLVTSWTNLWLLHCHTMNENQCPWLRELAALMNSEMTLVSGLHWVLL